MKAVSLVMIAGLLPLAACATDGAGSAASMSGAGHEAGAVATLRAADGAERGTAQVMDMAGGLHVRVSAKGLPPGAHAVHVHMTGTCTAPDFASAGGHWNPTGKQHGADNPQGKHMGDMPNMTVDAAGTGTLDYMIAGGNVTGGSAPLLDADGAAIVIHAAADDMVSDPAGNAGGRIACGVIMPG